MDRSLFCTHECLRSDWERILRRSSGCVDRKYFKEWNVFAAETHQQCTFIELFQVWLKNSVFQWMLFFYFFVGDIDVFWHAVCSELDLPGQPTGGIKSWEAAEGPDREDVSVWGVADGTAFIEHTCNILLKRKKKNNILTILLYFTISHGHQCRH